jgi:hypothetical protein
MEASTGVPPSSGVRGGEVRGLILLAVTAVVAGTGSVEAVKGEVVPGHANTPPAGWDKNGSWVHARPLLGSLGRHGHQQV